MLVEPVDWAEPPQKINRRAAGDWLESLQACSMSQYRKKIQQGGEPVFVLDQDSSFLNPIWLLLLREKDGLLLRVTTPKNPLTRKLTSIRQVYQIARTSGLRSVSIPVERKR
ncbi:hypothetical protein LP421_33710 (plasmid) [Rhizobium sp. RCAM05350]|uniref:hypothetical protein n=1 Tax=Rhizobium sp. RCAM05350 TaxID=2895568 RepID=UPI002076945C|nr:hypothetical protein [Rhizobium sp. RCAM05350]URK89385.1 hypothetical protein LP421_33710 [Rhizobium sp. RCAM05350]